MMDIYINNVKTSVSSASTLEEILQLKGIADTHLAIAVNQQFVPRSHFKLTVIKHNDRLDLIIPMQGG